MNRVSKVVWIASVGVLGMGCPGPEMGDTGPGGVDTGVGTIDTGVRPNDTGVRPNDTGVRPNDTGTAPIDTGTMMMLDAGTDAFTACTATQYRNAMGVCTALAVCTATQYESTAPTASSDRVCSDLAVCTATQYESTAATATSNRVCSDLAVCTATQYESTAATASSDRICTALTACTATQFESTAATATRDRVCSALTDCAAGQFVMTAATATTNRVCAPCAAGTFSSATNTAACAAWAVCTTPGQFEMTAGSATANRVCTTCGAGTSNCDGAAANTCEVNTNTSDANCGRCGTVCAGATTCVMGVCSGAVVTGPTFTAPALATTGCNRIEHVGVTGDDRGGIAVSGSQVFYSGDSSTGRFSRTDLSGGAALGRIHDALFSDLTTEQVYAFGDAAGTFSSTSVFSGGLFVADRFYALNSATGAVGAATMLSAPISLSNARGFQIGYFSGASRVVVAAPMPSATGSRLYNITLPSGAVQDLGPYTLPALANCESSGFWGVSEFSGGNLSILYVANNTTISRAQVFPAGATTTYASFTNLSDMCSFTVSPSAGRWYWHHEGTSQFGGIDESIGYCDLATPPTP